MDTGAELSERIVKKEQEKAEGESDRARAQTWAKLLVIMCIMTHMQQLYCGGLFKLESLSVK